MGIRISCNRFPLVNARSHYSTQQASPSGLRFIPKFLNRIAQEQLLAKSLRLHQQIEQMAQGVPGVKATTYLSKQHNLKTDEYYNLVSFETNGVRLNLQHFPKYGEEGHTLTYFIGRENIPEFVRETLISPMEKIGVVQDLKARKHNIGSFDWNLTLNTYKPPHHKPNQMPGFDFHKDTPSNGEITAIFTLLSEAEIEMKQDESSPVSYSETLIPGSLFLLSGQSRWDWLHRVQPRDVPLTDAETIRRISLVLGCH